MDLRRAARPRLALGARHGRRRRAVRPGARLQRPLGHRQLARGHARRWPAPGSSSTCRAGRAWWSSRSSPTRAGRPTTDVGRWSAFPDFLTHADRAASSTCWRARGRRSRTTSARSRRRWSRLYERDGYCWVVTGSTEEGRAQVDPSAVPQAIAYYRGARRGRKEGLRRLALRGGRPPRFRSTSTGRSSTTRWPTRGRDRWSRSTGCAAAPARRAGASAARSGANGTSPLPERATGASQRPPYASVCDANLHRNRPSAPRAGDRARPQRGRTGEPQPRCRSGHRDRRVGGRRGLARRARRPARRGQRDRRLRRRRPRRGDAVRLARALLPPGPDPALHRRDPRSRHQARRRGQRRPDRKGVGTRPGDPARRGCRGGRSPTASWRTPRDCSTRPSASTRAPAARGFSSSRR